MQRPPQVTPASLADYLEMMSRAIFSAGLSWRVIDAKWDGTRAAFRGFAPERVATYTPDDVERLMADPRVIHNRKKIEAIVSNAGELIVTDRDFGGIDRYLGSFESSEELVKDLHKRFKFVGEFAARYFLYAVKFDEQAQEKWAYEQMDAKDR